MVSIVYCFRNRDLERVKRSLNSLQNQLNHDFEVVFVDYGSDRDIARNVADLLEIYPFVQYLYTDTTGKPWNRSHALNIGIKCSNSAFVFTADIDMVFIPDFVSQLHKIKSVQKATFFPCYLLPSKFNDWHKLFKLHDFEQTNEQGLGLSLIPKKALEEIHGYDEYYSFWGREDNDLYKRLKSLGLEANYHSDDVLMYHQWHEPTIASHELFPNHWRYFMRNYFNNNNTNIRNLKQWGVSLSKEERSAAFEKVNQTIKFALDDINFDNLSYFKTRFINGILNADKVVKFSVPFSNTDSLVKSKVYKIAQVLNNILKKLNIPITATLDNEINYIRRLDLRDELIFMIHALNNHIEDYKIIESNSVYHIWVKKYSE